MRSRLQKRHLTLGFFSDRAAELGSNGGEPPIPRETVPTGCHVLAMSTSGTYDPHTPCPLREIYCWRSPAIPHSRGVRWAPGSSGDPLRGSCPASTSQML